MKSRLYLIVLLAMCALAFTGCGGSGGSSGSANPVAATSGGVLFSGRLAGEGDLGNVPVYLVGVDAQVPPLGSLRASAEAAVMAGQLYFSVTDESGAFAFQNVTPGYYNLVARKDRNIGGIRRNLAVGLQASTMPADLELLLTATGEITGQVAVPADFSGRSGVVAFVPGTSYAAYTDENGAFAITGVPVGSYSVLFSAPGLAKGRVDNISVGAAQATTLPLITLSRDNSFFIGITWKGTQTAHPASPQPNWAYYNSTDKKAYIFDGSAWQILAESITGPQGPAGANGVSIAWQGSLPAHPATPTLNWAYYNTADGKSYIYNGTSWQVLASDGQIGPQGPAGISLVWKGTLASPPANPQMNWAYYNYVEKRTYVWDGIRWQVLTRDGDAHPLPFPPENPTAVGGPSLIAVSWPNWSGYSYNIYFSTTPGVTRENGTRLENCTSTFNHVDLTNGTRYYYVITTVGPGGESVESVEVSAVPGYSTFAAPANISVVASQTTVCVSWPKVNGAVSYNVYYATSPGVTTANGIKLENKKSPTFISGLQRDTTYYFVVMASDSEGKTALSQEASVKTHVFSAGTGSRSDPFIIKTADQLNSVRWHLTSHFKQMAGISLSTADLAGFSWYDAATGWEPIGSSPEFPFQGSYLGGSISGLTINRPTSEIAGLFGYISNNAVLDGVGIANTEINARKNLGALVGVNNGKLLNCISSGFKTTGVENIGGLVGVNYGSIHKCTTKGQASGSIAIGGLTGRNMGGIITNCVVSFNASGSQLVGGLAGANTGSVMHCGSFARIDGDIGLGGLIGSSHEASIIRECASYGYASGGANVGGLVGATYGATIENCYSHASVEAEQHHHIGGLIGTAESQTLVKNCYSTGRVDSESIDGFPLGGGLIGDNAGCHIISSYWNTETSERLQPGLGDGKTTAEMFIKCTYWEWDFTEVWSFPELPNTGYPWLQNCEYPPEIFAVLTATVIIPGSTFGNLR